MRRVQLRGGARTQSARRTKAGRAAAAGEASGYGTLGERERATLSRLSRAPYLRRWTLIIALVAEHAAAQQAQIQRHEHSEHEGGDHGHAGEVPDDRPAEQDTPES